MTLHLKQLDLDHTNMSTVKTKVNRDQKRVLKDFPNARLTVDDNGNLIVMSGDVFLAEEYFLPETQDPDTAWKYAAVACRTTQNFNRTHPDRMDMTDIETKIMRINNRLNR